MKDNFEIKEEEMTMITSRILPASPKLVYDYFTDKEHLDNWYGPQGCSIETSHFDFREGGVWNYTMHLPNGNTFDAFQVFTEIRAAEQLTFESAQTDDAPKEEWFTTTIEFKEHADGTEVVVSMSYQTEATFEQAKKFGAIGGYVSALSELEEYIKNNLS